LLLPYLLAQRLGDLRAHTPAFEMLFFAAFGGYVVAVLLALRLPAANWQAIFILAVLFRLLLIPTRPALSDDMYRYIWDGRVQAGGINPYAYAPNAPEVQALRDPDIWPSINRKNAVTIYPAGAQLAFAALWRLWPDNVHWLQIVMAAADLLAGLLLMALLRALQRPPHLALIYLWHPLVIFEIAHAAHVDGLMLPLVVGAWLAQAKGRDAWAGVLLGAATAMKLFPVLLLPTLWRPLTIAAHRAPEEPATGHPFLNLRKWQWSLAPGWWVMPVAFVLVLVLAYIPYLSLGLGVAGFLPGYFGEQFNMGLAGVIINLAGVAGQPDRVVSGIMVLILAIASLVFLLRPPVDAAQAIRRSIWPIGVFVLFTQNLFPWYLLIIIPLLALFLQPGRFGLRWDAWAAWFLFSGLVALAYTFFIVWKPVTWALYAQYVPLYVLLIFAGIRAIVQANSVARTQVNGI
ncbi:MAG: hypothetical protein HY326_05575, partial [Chloroflexi bacterium]|nr:hypothetical protein [Chloroflexota bacterium]